MQEASAKYQYLAAIVVNLLTMSYGITCGWASPSLMVLMSDKTPLPSGKITIDEASWIAAFLCIGGLIGNILFGFVTSRFGRKKPLLVVAIPTVVSWLLILYAQDVYYLYAARALNGFAGGGMFVIVPLFLTEIASDRVRGMLGSTLVLIANSGILLAFVLGDYCDFYTTPKIAIALTCAFVALMFFFPETPPFLMKQNRVSETEKSIRFYQNMSGKGNDYELLQVEMNKLKSTIKITDTEISNKNSLKCSDFKVKEARKAFTIGIVLAVLNQFCGCFAMLQYTASIFKEAGSTMLPNTSAIVVGVIQLLGSYVPTALVDRAGRKFLFAVSTIGTALGLTSLGVYMMLKSWNYGVESFNWVPIASFSFCIFIANWAILTLPFLVISEIMPEKLKDFGTSFCMSLLWSSSFFVIKFLPLLTTILGMHGNMFLFGGICLFSFVFVIVYMPETKGKSHEEIMKSLR